MSYIPVSTVVPSSSSDAKPSLSVTFDLAKYFCFADNSLPALTFSSSRRKCYSPAWCKAICEPFWRLIPVGCDITDPHMPSSRSIGDLVAFSMFVYICNSLCACDFSFLTASLQVLRIIFRRIILGAMLCLGPAKWWDETWCWDETFCWWDKTLCWCHVILLLTNAPGYLSQR